MRLLSELIYAPNMKILTSLLCVFFLTPVDAAVYKWVDAAGNIHFSDQSQEGSTQVELREPTVFPGIKPTKDKARSEPAGKSKEETAETPAYSRLSITSPANDVTIWAGDGNVEVDVDLEPPLQEGHRLVLKFNGTPLDQRFDEGRLRMENVDRGSHRLTAEIHDQAGAVAAQSETVVFHLRRASIQKKPKAPKSK